MWRIAAIAAEKAMFVGDPSLRLLEKRSRQRKPTMESMPFFHADRVFTIVFNEDLTFLEVRAILDQLLAKNAFDFEVQEDRGFYRLEVEAVSFQVWVSEMDVIIKKE
jgi:hypothetical protein